MKTLIPEKHDNAANFNMIDDNVAPFIINKIKQDVPSHI